MIYRIPLAVLLALLVTVAFCADVQAPSTAEQQRAQRGRAIRALILDLQAQVDGNPEAWPEHLPARADLPDLVYTRPDASVRSKIFSELSGVTVLVNETLSVHPDGAWVGYPDGHLELVTTDKELAACREQLAIAKASIAEHGSLGGTPPDEHANLAASGALQLRIVDPQGKPVEAALVGIGGRFGDAYAQERVKSFDN